MLRQPSRYRGRAAADDFGDRWPAAESESASSDDRAGKDREIQARSHGEEEERRQELIDGLGARLQVPARRIIREGQPGEKGADDGRHADVSGRHRESEAERQGKHQRSILGLHLLNAGLQAVHHLGRNEDHEHGKADGFGRDQAKVHPLDAAAAAPC